MEQRFYGFSLFFDSYLQVCDQLLSLLRAHIMGEEPSRKHLSIHQVLPGKEEVSDLTKVLFTKLCTNPIKPKYVGEQGGNI
jgi:hypothetical protein